MPNDTPVTEVPTVTLTESTPLPVWEADMRRQLAAQGIEEYVAKDVPRPQQMDHDDEINPTHKWDMDQNLAKAIIFRSLSSSVFHGLENVGIDLWAEDDPKITYDEVIIFMSFRKALNGPTSFACLAHLQLEGGEQLSMLPRAGDDSDYQYYLRLFLIHVEKLEEGGCSLTDAARFQLFLRGLSLKYVTNIEKISKRVKQGWSWEAFQNDVLNGTEVLGGL